MRIGERFDPMSEPWAREAQAAWPDCSLMPMWLSRAPVVTPGAKWLYALLTRYCGPGGRIRLDTGVLAEALAVTDNKIQRLLKELIRHRCVERVMQPEKDCQYFFIRSELQTRYAPELSDLGVEL